MTILQALNGYYARLDDQGKVAKPGWSPEKFGWCIILNTEGEPVDVLDLRDLTGKKPKVLLYKVPASFSRPGTTPRPFFLWDKTAFSLGVTKSTSGWKVSDREYAAFRQLHLDRLENQEDDGLVAMRRFLEKWTPEKFAEKPFDERPDILDANIMFRLDGDRCYLHERPASRKLIGAANKAEGDKGEGVLCLITGERSIPARLHPTIKGVEGAQSSGAALVSFNRDAFTSLGKDQGANAPVSEAAAFRYGAALNHLLTRDGPNRIRRPVGDATIVFWADVSGVEGASAEAADTADAWSAAALQGSDFTDEQEAASLRTDLEALAQGRPLSDLKPEIEPGTKFHVLGLSPNAARLAVRYWFSDDLDVFARRLAEHYQDLRLEPAPYRWGGAPSVNRLLVSSTALREEFKNIPPLLAGEVMRSILSGTRYPQSLLASALIRLRAGDNAASGWHAAVIRAVLQRDHRLKNRNQHHSEKGEIPVSLNKEHPNTGYQLGRLFAVYEMAQRSALGRVNASIRDKYFGSASATPASVFPLIVRGGQNHLSKLRKEKPGWAHLIEKELEEIHSHIEPKQPFSLPRSLPLKDQGEFAIGYYHQRATKLTSEKGEVLDPNDLPAESDNREDV